MRLWLKWSYRIALCASMFLLLAGVATVKAQQGEVGAPERQARQAYEDGDNEAVLALCEQAVAQDPKAAWAYVLQVSVIINTEYSVAAFEEARGILERGLARGAESAEMHLWHAYALDFLGCPEEALSAIERAIALDSTQSNYYRLQYLVLDDLGRHEEAEAAREKCYALEDAESAKPTESPVADAPRDVVEFELPGMLKAFEDPRWAGYAPVATAYDDEASDPSTVFVLMRKGEHNVLCLLKRASEGYAMAWENDRAFYQGDRTPKMFYDGHLDGYLYCVYPMSGTDLQTPYEQELEFICDEEGGEWRFMRMSYCFRDAKEEYGEITKLSLERMDDRLVLQRGHYDYRGRYLGEDDDSPLAGFPCNAKYFVMKTYQIESSDADFKQLWNEAQEKQKSKSKGTAQSPTPTQAALEALFDTTPFDRFAQGTYPQDACHAKSGALTVPEDLDGDGLDEVVYRLGEEGLLYLRMREGKVELACPRIDFRGCGAVRAKIIRMQDTEGKYILLDLTDEADLRGFWLMRLEDGAYDFVAYDACNSYEGTVEIVDLNQDGQYDTCSSHQRSKDVFTMWVTKSFAWKGDHFEISWAKAMPESMDNFVKGAQQQVAGPAEPVLHYLALKEIIWKGTDVTEALNTVLDIPNFTSEKDVWDVTLLEHLNDAWYGRDGYDMAITEVAQAQPETTVLIVHLRQDRRAFAEITCTLELREENEWRITKVEAVPLDPADAG